MSENRNRGQNQTLFQDDICNKEGEEDELLKEKSHYKDYYEFIASSKTIRPICITEGEGLESMTWVKKVLWWIGTLLKLLSLIILSVRTDRLSDLHYLKHHWLHYGGMLAFALLCWTPQVIDTLGSYGVVEKGIFEMSTTPAFMICTFGLFYYILSISFFFKCMGPWMIPKIGKAKTLRFWEYFVSLGWQIQTTGFWVLTITPPIYQAELAIIPTWLTTSVGAVLIVFGIGSKMGAIYGTGYNTYYWYDMVVDIPNDHFVEVGIYKYCGSPTYTLGRGTSFGAALVYRSLPMMVAGVADLILINVFNLLVEQPSVRRMYMKPKLEEVDASGTVMNL